ncbi:MAG: HNH endonuclease [Candidatus Thermoplasmatota archaeon]|nr:HNH endonuclease [Candidatus Thermoplasmatota archaeon]
MSEEEVQKLVSHWTQYCIEYIESGRQEKKKKIKLSDRVDIESHIGDKCPTCAEKMVPQSHIGKMPPGHLPEKHGITVEHIVPRVLGGDNRRLNLVAMCHRCNQCRNAIMNEVLPHIPTIRGSKLDKKVKVDFSRYIEWSIRTIHTPNSEKVDANLSDLFEKEKMEDESRRPRMIAKAERRAAKVHTKGKKASKRHKQQPHGAEPSLHSDQVLDVLKEILETQKAILERLEKSPFRRFREWIFGFLPKKKKRVKIEQSVPRKRKRNRRRSGEKRTQGENKSVSGPKYFCPTCDAQFNKWKQAKLHKKETGHGCRVCDDCGEFFSRESDRQAHEDYTGHTKYSGNFFGQKRMSIKHFLPEERMIAVNTLGKNEVDSEGFSKVIVELLGDDVVRATALGNRVRSYQKENKWPRLGSKAFLDAFGIPPKDGLVNSIISIMGDRITVIGDDPVTRSVKMRTSEDPQEIDVPTISEETADSTVKPHDSIPKGFEQSDMRREILSVLVRPMAMPEFNTNLMKSLRDGGYDGYTAKSFLHACGIPKSWTMHRTLKTYFSDTIQVDGDPTNGIVTPLSSQQENQDQDPNDPAPESSGEIQPVVEKYPQVRLFNTSAKGIRFPRQPSDTALTIQYSQKALESGMTSTPEVTGFINEKTSISKARISRVADYCLRDYRSIGADGSPTPSFQELPSIHDLLEKVESYAIERLTTEPFELIEEDFKIINSYFSEVRRLLSEDV